MSAKTTSTECGKWPTSAPGRSTTRTCWPLSTNCRTRWLPMKPAPPVTIVSPFIPASVSLCPRGTAILVGFLPHGSASRRRLELARGEHFRLCSGSGIGAPLPGGRAAQGVAEKGKPLDGQQNENPQRVEDSSQERLAIAPYRGQAGVIGRDGRNQSQSDLPLRPRLRPGAEPQHEQDHRQNLTAEQDGRHGADQGRCGQ